MKKTKKNFKIKNFHLFIYNDLNKTILCILRDFFYIFNIFH